MLENGRYWVGADPGGKGKFGLAFLDGGGKLSCELVSSVDEAVKAIVDRGEPLALGIDAPMWWSSGEAGGRKVDETLRRVYGIPSGTVQSANSLRGAALVGGALLASRIRDQFPRARIEITETHPKALLYLPGFGRDSFQRKFEWSGWSRNEDEQDAAIAAVCAREGFSGNWTTDLADKRFRNESEQDPKDYWLAPMHYFWPHDPDGMSS